MAAAAASTATLPMMTTKMMFSNNNMSYSLPPRPQSNFFRSGSSAGDEPSSSSNASVDCANFHPQAQQQHHRQNNDEALKRFHRHVGNNDVNEFETMDFSSQFKDFACGAGDDGVVADDMEQLFCSDLFTDDVAAAAAARQVSNGDEPSPDTVELMSPSERKISDEAEGSMASSIPSQGSAGDYGQTVGMNYGSSAEVTAGSSPMSPFVNADTSMSPFKGSSYFPKAGFPEVHPCPPQGYGGVNSNHTNASVPTTIAVPQAPPQMNFDPSTDPIAAAVAASAQFFQMNDHMNEPSLQFCHSLAKETQFSNGAAASVCPQPSKHTCAKCHFPGSDIKIKSCPNGCTYHARCLDLISLCNQKSNVNNTHHVHNNERGVTPPPSALLDNNGNMNGGFESQGMLTHCPCCFSAGATGIEILPLDFDELDLVQRKVAEENEAKQRSSQFSTQGVPTEVAAAVKSGAKRSHDEINSLADVSSSSAAACSSSELSSPKCYDPSFPRTGRWTSEEIAFRDALVALFLAGNLPLTNGLKLNDFLHTMLKSKQSRLAKKMKNAKLSTKYFFPKSGFVDDMANDDQLASTTPKSFTAEEFSKLEMKFISSIQDPVERSEIIFHMKKEWREHFAQRCHYLRIDFDGRAWLASVDEMERRLTTEKNRIKSAKRRFLMSKAMEKDASTTSRMPGVFVDVNDTSRDEFDKIVERTVMNTSNSQNSMHMGLMNIENALAKSHGFGEHSATSSSAASSKKAEKESSLNLYSASNDPNFKHAAPFLSGVASYIERNSIPFEHIDVWVPSYVDGNSSMGTGSKSQSGNFRLCFGGSATMGVQIVNNEPNPDGTSQKPVLKRAPITQEDKTNFSMFGTYSEKFSFDTGCGLPGRVFQSGVPAWEQFVSESHPSLFERRGGAAQFGVKSALGIPIESPNVGRIVLVMYSKHDRMQNSNLMERLMNDLKLLNPAPRWKLVVDVGPAKGSKDAKNCPSSLHQPPAIQKADTVSPPSPRSLDPVKDARNKQINDLIFLLGEQIPLDMNSTLGQQIHGIMSLRLVLLRPHRTPEEEALVTTILVLYESYLQAGRPSHDIACMLARDFCFHLQHGVQQQMMMSFSQGMQ